MFEEHAFALLCETLKKCRVRITAALPQRPVTEIMDDSLKPFLDGTYSAGLSLAEAFGDLQMGILYRFQDALSLSYLAFLAPIAGEDQLILIGPYVHIPFSPERILEISSHYGSAPGRQQVIENFFAAIPVLPENSAVFLLIDAFCERLWHGSYQIVDIQRKTAESLVRLPEESRTLDDTFLDMKNMERRYQVENELMDAVSMGLDYKVNQIFTGFTESAYEQRLSDPIRNLKNYCIILNTLLRKAAERGGVHPMELNKISSRYAHKIEQLSGQAHVQPLMADMFRSYCLLVRSRAAKAHCTIVRKAITAIDADLSAELNLHTLAQKLNVSKEYLSSVFKKETGKTLTRYIREKRLLYAEHLLKTTALQVQTIALQCGMVDVHYFSKQFKELTGKTPSQFRSHQAGRL